MRFFAAFLSMVLALCATTAWAQDPQIKVNTEQEDVMVGQPYTVRIDLLVPTFMPSPPVFPSFEAPGLIVRLPERSTSPISERISGDTWAGVRRTYRIYPTQEGTIELPPQQVSFVYKDPETNEDIAGTAEVPAITIKATVPPDARGLDPLILAQNVTIDQEWQISDDALTVGDAVVRTLRISVVGTSALFVPDLLAEASPAPASAETDEGTTDAARFLGYPEDAIVSESIDRGVLSGTRTEQVSYIAQGGGQVVFPDIMLSWYNIDTGEIEDVVLSGRSVTVQELPQARGQIDPRSAARLLVLLMAGTVAAWAVRRWLWHHISARLMAARHRYAATAQAAHRTALERARAKDLTGLLSALELRAMRGSPPPTTLKQALTALTRAKYRDEPDSATVLQAWRSVETVLKDNRPGLWAAPFVVQSQTLPRLNPFGDGAGNASQMSRSKVKEG